MKRATLVIILLAVFVVSCLALTACTPPKHTVTWLDWDGTVLEVDVEVEEGTIPTYNGATPIKKADEQYTYEFSGWDKPLTAVMDETVYTAKFDAVLNSYSVTWLNWDGAVLQMGEVQYGQTPAYTGLTPIKEGNAQFTYTFVGWNPTVEQVTGNVTYVAQFASEVNKYTVTWLNWDGYVLEVDENIEYGTMPSYDGQVPTIESDAQYTYAFLGWNQIVGAVTGNATYVAQFVSEINKYTVTWLNWDGDVLKLDENIEYGTMPSYNGQEPTKEANAQYTYIFAGWNPTVDSVTGNATYVAQFTSEVNKYTVTWLGWDGSVLEVDGNIEYGTMPTYDAETPTRERDSQYTYTFIGWGTTVDTVTGDATYIAQFTSKVNKYAVTWLGWDGSVLEVDENIEYGTMPTYDAETPTRERDAQYTYTFIGWGPTVDTVTGDATYIAQFTSKVNKYTVNWLDWDGTVLEVNNDVEYGTTPTYNGETPTKDRTDQYIYTFVGWTPIVENITGDETYTACYEESIRTTFYITFNPNGGQGIVATLPINVGSTVTLSSDIPTYTNHRFVGWNNMYEDKVYQPGDTFSLARDIELWAMWEEIAYCNGCKHTGKVTVTSTCPFCNRGTICGMCGSSGGVTVINGYDEVCSVCLSRRRVTCTSCNGNYKKETTYDCSFCQGRGYNPVIGAPAAESVSQTTIVLQTLSGYEYSMDGFNWQSSPIFENLTPNTSYTFYQRKAKTDTEPFGVTTMGAVITTDDYYVVTYYLQDGDSHDNPNKYADNSQIVLNPATRTGYTFLGWHDSDGNLVEVLGDGISGDIALYAQWNDGDVYTVELDPNGAELADCWMEFQYDHEYSLPIPTLENYAFLGWYNEEDRVYSNGTWRYNTNKLVAKWTIAFDVVDGVLVSAHDDATSIVIPDGVTSIGNWAFEYCTSLTSITIPDSVTSIGYGAFEGCSSLTSITIPDSVTSIGDCAFYGCPIEQAIIPAIASAYINNSNLKEVIITSGDTIPDYAFSGCTSLTSITIPDSVTSIGECAFYDCSSLTSITLPFVGATLDGTSNTHFGYIFGASSYSQNYSYVPSSLKTVVITGGSSIGGGAFYGCSSLTSITIPDSVTSIGYGAFYGCSSLTSITIPDSVTSIGGSAFSGCSGLTSITLPFVGATLDGTSNTHFGYIFGASSYSQNYSYVPSSLKTVVITGGSSISSSAFYDCSSLTSITIPDSVTSIGYGAFVYCSRLTSVTIGNSVKSIGEWAFYNCSGLTSVYITDVAAWCNISFGDYYSNPLYYADNLYLNNQLVTELVITDGVTSIGSSAFRGCSSLTSITIPQSVTTIGEGAFYGCSSLTSITIPDSVTSIGDYVFRDCSSLKDVYYTGTEEQWNNISIGASNTPLTNATIHYNCTGEEN